MDEPRRGRLTVYLGAAPGVGKTYAMLGEARRRHDRGTDVVVGYVESHGRAAHRGADRGTGGAPASPGHLSRDHFTELDTDAVIARKPAVVCIDELAHTNVPGSPREKRAQDVELIRAAGIDVITTVNIQHLESLNDEVERITGVRQRETVPDEIVRTADQIQLVDMSPEALRRRMAHGNIYKPENIDASLTSYFRVGNLTALRELALLWLADRVDDALGDYRRAHRIEDTWPAKERIVVAVTGGAESETLIRRGARLAQRAAGSDLLAVHVIATDGLRNPAERRLGRAQQLVASLDGTFHSVVGEDVSAAVVDFASGANATMIVVGVSRHSRLRRLFTGTTGDRIASLAGSIDVHLVTHDEVARTARSRGGLASPLSRTRQVLGWLAAVLLPVVLTAALLPLRGAGPAGPGRGAVPRRGGPGGPGGRPLPGPVRVALRLPAAQLVLHPAGRAAHCLRAGEPGRSVRLRRRRGRGRHRGRPGVAPGHRGHPGPHGGRHVGRALTVGAHRAGHGRGDRRAAARDVRAGRRRRCCRRAPTGWAGGRSERGPVSGDTRRGRQQGQGGRRPRARAVRAARSARPTSACWRVSRCRPGWCWSTDGLRAREDRAAALESAEATSTALLRAVSHDLRTPLATMRASVDGLVSGHDLAPGDQASPGGGAGRVDRPAREPDRQPARPLPAPVRAAEAAAAGPLARRGAAARGGGAPAGAVSLEVDESVPMVRTDAGLLERVVANLVGNAVRVSDGHPVRVLAHVLPETVEIMVVDRGPGVPPDQRERMFEPFQRLDDTSPGGLGLGLAVARGLDRGHRRHRSRRRTPPAAG